MGGSTVSAMADAIDNAAVVIFAVSEPYKESANCRMELNYALNSKRDLLPLMVQANFVPKGWLGLILGTRLWHGFFGAVLETEEAFEIAMNGVARELGARGRGGETFGAPALAVPKLLPAAAAAAAAATAETTVAAPRTLLPGHRHRLVATATELTAAQARAGRMAEAGALDAAELDAIDDLLADFVSGETQQARWAAAQAVADLVELMSVFPDDDARLARQLRRRLPPLRAATS
eukprot:COSAG01_NODE_949_length_12505_cov_3.853539_7_plen_235_part_00